MLRRNCRYILNPGGVGQPRDGDPRASYALLDTEFQQVVRDAELGRRQADRLIRVARLSGEPALVYIHIEVQSQHEVGFAERMFVYVRGYTQVCIASAGGWYGRESTRDTHATWRGNPKGKTASWESGYGSSRTGPTLRKSRVLWRKLDCLNPNPHRAQDDRPSVSD